MKRPKTRPARPAHDADPAAPAMPDDPQVTFALLDGAGILTGYGAGPRSLAGALKIEVPDGCDLVPERYRYDADLKRFEPLRPFDDVPEDDPPTLRAIWAGFVSLALAGHDFPDETTAWLTGFGRRIDSDNDDLARNPAWRAFCERVAAARDGSPGA